MNCPNCNNLIKTVPAGVSKKTGKPYPAFQACSAQCGWKPEPKPQYQAPVPQATQVKPADNNIKFLELAVTMACRGEGMPLQDVVVNYFEFLKKVYAGDYGVPDFAQSEEEVSF